MDLMQELLELTPRKSQTQQVKLLGLSERAGKDILFTIRELSYREVKDIYNLGKDSQTFDVNTHIILAGVQEPNLKDKALLAHFNAITPAELLPKLMSAGEMEELSIRIEQLSGYRKRMTEVVDEIKKNSTTDSGTSH